jgi:hypothetical protein
MSVNAGERQEPASTPGSLDRRAGQAARLAAAAAVFALGAGAAAGLSTTLALLPHPFEVNYGEGIVLGVAARMARGEPLYQPISDYPYLVAAYTPLYYTILAALIQLAGPALWPARAVSLSGALLTAACLYGVVRRERGPRPALLAALLFAATPWVAQWAGYGRVDMPALGLTAVGVWLAWRPSPERWRLALSLLCFLGAFLTKQTYLAAPLVTALALALQRPQLGGAYVGAFAMLVLVSVGGLQQWSHGMFVQSAVVANLNPTDVFWGLRIAKLWLALSLWLHAAAAGALLLQLAALRRAGRSLGTSGRKENSCLRSGCVTYTAGVLRGGTPAKYTVQGRHARLFVCRLSHGTAQVIDAWCTLPVPVAAAATYLVFTLCQMPTVLKIGSDVNYLLENAFAVSLLTGLVLPEAPLKAGSSVRFPCIALELWLLVSISAAGMGMLDLARSVSVLPWAVDHRAWQRHALLVERIRQAPGDVLAEDLSLPVVAGKSAVFEPALYDIFFETGTVGPGGIVGALAGGRFDLLLLSSPMDRPGWETDPQIMWPRAIRGVMRARYCLAERIDKYYVYVPAEACAPAAPRATGAAITRSPGPPFAYALGQAGA